MRYCSHCGNEVYDSDTYCSKCGAKLNEEVKYTDEAIYSSKPNKENMVTLVKAFMIIGCLCLAPFLIPLIWCIPMTLKAFRCMDCGEKLSPTFKVCTLIFVNLIAGLALLLTDEL